MSVIQEREPSSEARVVQVLDEYLAALRAGAAPDKEKLLAQHPDVASELGVCLASLDFIHQTALSASANQLAPGSPAGDAFPGGVLGDYRIIAEVARGGMGVVYEAEQVSLGRRVALKVLPFAATLDPKRLQRFQNEARAAGWLHHTNIVPVYAVGCERGVHYYAMQFIDGQTLAALIREMREQETAGKDEGRGTKDEGQGTKDEGRRTKKMRTRGHLLFRP